MRTGLHPIVALFLFVIVVGSVAFVVADENYVYSVDAVVVNYETTPWNDIEVEVVDKEGNIWGYFVFPDEDVHIGDIVTLTIFRFSDEAEEDDEIVDVEHVDHLSTIEMIRWLTR